MWLTILLIAKIFALIIAFSAVGATVLIWVGARIAYYVTDRFTTKTESFNLYTAYHFGTKKNYINITDKAIKLAAFGCLIYNVYQLWQAF